MFQSFLRAAKGFSLAKWENFSPLTLLYPDYGNAILTTHSEVQRTVFPLTMCLDFKEELSKCFRIQVVNTD